MNHLRAIVASLILALGLAGGTWGQSLIVNFDDYTLTEEDSPLIVSHVIIQNNGTLFLEPGAELVITGKDDENRPLWLRHGGRLIASGTREKPVIIRQSAPNSIVVAERWGGEDHGTIIDLDHTIWDMGVSRLVLIEYPEENYPDAEPIIFARNSIIRSSPPTPSDEEDWWWEWEGSEPYQGPMIMSVGDNSGDGIASPMHLLFEDSLIASPTVSAIGIADNQVLTMRRCVVQGARIEEDGFRFGIQVLDFWRGSLIKVEDCRFVGNTAGIGHFGEVDENIRIVQVSGSDFSQTGYFLMDWGYGPFFLSVEDSQIWHTYIDSTFGPRTMVFIRCFSEDGPPYTDTPGNEIVIDPLDDPLFRHADFNNDGLTNYADLRILMSVLAGSPIPDGPDGPIYDVDDIDGDGDITIRDAALLRAYVDGTLLFLPPEGL